jgi:hypothetical protein
MRQSSSADLQFRQQQMQQLGGRRELLLLFVRERAQAAREQRDAAAPSLLQQRAPELCGGERDAATVIGCDAALDQPCAFQAADDAAHRGRAYLLGAGKFFQRHRAAEDEHGECRGLRRADAHRRILQSETAQQTDGGGVQPIGDCLYTPKAGAAKILLARA